MAAKSLVIHGAVLLVAGVLAFRTWTREEDTAPKHGEVNLWPGRIEQVKEVRFESKVGTIRLEPREDSNGRYFIGNVKKNPEPAKTPAPADSAVMSPAEPPAPAGPKVSTFIATKDGEELVSSLAPLRALRVLGKVKDSQKVDFGFDQDEGKLFMRVGGTDRALVFGGPTPGGTDRYAKDPATGNAYVVAGSILRDLTSADQRLIEHNLHGWEEGAPKRVKITAGSGNRELLKNAEKKDVWTKPGEPNGKDETATNWMSKLDRLRVTSYEGEKLSPPPAPADLVVRVDYYDDRKTIGFIELVRRPATGDKPEYAARTEHTRWYATVVRSSAEQVEQDLKSVVVP